MSYLFWIAFLNYSRFPIHFDLKIINRGEKRITATTDITINPFISVIRWWILTIAHGIMRLVVRIF